MMERKMKDSGIPWIGEIPEEWDVVRIKSLYAERTELSSDGSEMLLSISEYYGVAPTEEKTDNDFITRAETLVGYKKCFKNDFVSNIMLAWKGSFGTTDYDGIVSPAYCVYKPIKDVSPHYYHYLLRTDLFKCVFKQYSKGVIDSRLRLYSPYFLAIHTVYPPFSEQEKIASWLDKKCSEIDELIEVEQMMIEKLEAYRQATITDAVTHGLNRDVEMRQTNIAWLSHIPKHWELCRLKDKLSKTMQYGANESGDNFEEKQPRYIRITDITTDGKLKNEDKKSLSIELSKPYLLEEGDILFARSGATVGKAFIYHKEYGPAAYAGYLIRAKANPTLLPLYLFYYTQTSSYEQWKNAIFIQATIQNIGADKYSFLPICVPPLSEQQAIADYLDTKCKEIDDLIAVKRQKIETLKQYRQSIIFEAVTGKIQLI